MKKALIYFVVLFSLVAFTTACGPRIYAKHPPSAGKVLKKAPKVRVPLP